MQKQHTVKFLTADAATINNRIYPQHELIKAVGALSESLTDGKTIFGQCGGRSWGSYSQLEHVSHKIVSVWNDKLDWYATIEFIHTPMGNKCQLLAMNGVQLGSFPRGTGFVDNNGVISDYKIITIDVLIPNEFI